MEDQGLSEVVQSPEVAELDAVGADANPAFGQPAWIIAAGVVAQVALIGAPLAQARPTIGPLLVGLLLLAPAALFYGAARRSPGVLLAGVPLAWLSPGFSPQISPSAWTGLSAVLGLLCALTYLVLTSAWLRKAPQISDTVWMQLGQVRGRPRVLDPVAIVGALVVVVPAAGVAVWPEIQRRLSGSFPQQWGRLGVALALLGTVIGLAMTTDLARGRAQLTPSFRRVIVLSVASASAAGLWIVLAARL